MQLQVRLAIVALGTVLLCIACGCKSQDHRNTLGYAIIWEPETVHGMLASGQHDPNDSVIWEESPLTYAVTHQESAIVLDLLRHGADPTILPASEHERMVKRLHVNVTAQAYIALLDAGLDPNATAAIHSPLFELCEVWNRYTEQETRQVLDKLIECGVDLNRQNSRGQTALHESVLVMAHFKRPQGALVAEALIQAGADLSLQDGQGQTPLHIALGAGDYDLAQKLIDAGAPLGIPDGRGHTALAMITRSPRLRDSITLPVP